MGNCAGYCAQGQGESEEGQIRQSFNKQDMTLNNKFNDFEKQYGKLPAQLFDLGQVMPNRDRLLFAAL